MTSSANAASATVSGPVRRTGSFDLAYELLVVAGLEGNEYPTSERHGDDIGQDASECIKHVHRLLRRCKQQRHGEEGAG